MYRLVYFSLFCMSSFVSAYTEDTALFYGEYSKKFVSRWAIQEYCHHTYDFREKYRVQKDACALFYPDEVKVGDLVFVRDVNSFMEEMHPKIKNPYIMVTAGEQKDQARADQEPFLDDPMIIAWFSVHPCCFWFSSKFHPLPLGVHQKRSENKRQWDRYTKFFAELRKKEKEGLLHMNFEKRHSPHLHLSYKDRDRVYNLFKNKSYCYLAPRRDFKAYLKEMANYKFTLSPEGFGPDCYRNWEALLVGTIPIIKSSSIDSLYTDLPVLIVDDWTDITPGLLEEKWKEFTHKRFNIEKLFIEYWGRQILAVRQEFLKTYQGE